MGDEDLFLMGLKFLSNGLEATQGLYSEQGP